MQVASPTAAEQAKGLLGKLLRSGDHAKLQLGQEASAAVRCLVEQGLVDAETAANGTWVITLRRFDG